MPQSFSARDRLFWWIKMLGVAIPLAIAIAGSTLAFGRWAYTRASMADIEMLDRKKKDKIEAEIERRTIEERVEHSAKVLGNVRDNLILLMERNRVQPKRLTDQLIEEP